MASTGIQGLTGLSRRMPSTGIQGLTGLSRSRATNAPIGTPMYPGGSDQLNWPWAKFFSELQDSSGSGTVTGGGATGIRGPAGVPGVTGIQGGTGIQGITGLKGLGNFIQDGFPQPIEDPALLWNFQDEALYVGVTGVEGNWVQVGAGSQGVTGIMGFTGLALGATGLIGVTGLQGPGGGDQGNTGIMGNTGVQGVTGIQGITGLRGIIGETGITGPTGIKGLANFIQNGFPTIVDMPQFLWNFQDEALYLGITGINGNWVQLGAGSRGSTGLFGPTGVRGFTGIHGITGIQGFTGIYGNTGLRGVTGLALGSTGIRGPTGIQGVTGFYGRTGIQGLTGFYGRTGIQGLTGIQGITGLRGITGLVGNTGIRGPQGYGRTYKFRNWTYPDTSFGGMKYGTIVTDSSGSLNFNNSVLSINNGGKIGNVSPSLINPCYPSLFKIENITSIIPPGSIVTGVELNYQVSSCAVYNGATPGTPNYVSSDSTSFKILKCNKDWSTDQSKVLKNFVIDGINESYYVLSSGNYPTGTFYDNYTNSWDTSYAQNIPLDKDSTVLGYLSFDSTNRYSQQVSYLNSYGISVVQGWIDGSMNGGFIFMGDYTSDIHKIMQIRPYTPITFSVYTDGAQGGMSGTRIVNTDQTVTIENGLIMSWTS